MLKQQIAEKKKYNRGFFDDIQNCEVENQQLFQPDSLSSDEDVSKTQVCTLLQKMKKQIKKQNEVQTLQSLTPQEDCLFQPEKNEEKLQTSFLKSKSIFHNLQKHLISFLKRSVNLKRVDLLDHPQGLNAYELWKMFRDGKSCTKKSLYIIVGLSSARNEQNMMRTSVSLPSLQKMLQKFPFQQIESAQTLLRESIVDALSRLNETFIRNQCKMNNFEEFYVYLASFVKELKGNGLSMRMKKQQKIRFLNRKQCKRTR